MPTASAKAAFDYCMQPGGLFSETECNASDMLLLQQGSAARAQSSGQSRLVSLITSRAKDHRLPDAYLLLMPDTSILRIMHPYKP